MSYIRGAFCVCACFQALSTASAFSDRLCIASKGAINKELSGEYINACCNGRCGDGCNGGHPEKAWKFVKSKGLCTGGDYGSKEVSILREIYCICLLQ